MKKEKTNMNQLKELYDKSIYELNEIERANLNSCDNCKNFIISNNIINELSNKISTIFELLLNQSENLDTIVPINLLQNSLNTLNTNTDKNINLLDNSRILKNTYQHTNFTNFNLKLKDLNELITSIESSKPYSYLNMVALNKRLMYVMLTSLTEYNFNTQILKEYNNNTLKQNLYFNEQNKILLSLLNESFELNLELVEKFENYSKSNNLFNNSPKIGYVGFSHRGHKKKTTFMPESSITNLLKSNDRKLDIKISDEDVIMFPVSSMRNRNRKNTRGKTVIIENFIKPIRPSPQNINFINNLISIENDPNEIKETKQEQKDLKEIFHSSSEEDNIPILDCSDTEKIRKKESKMSVNSKPKVYEEADNYFYENQPQAKIKKEEKEPIDRKDNEQSELLVKDFKAKLSKIKNVEEFMIKLYKENQLAEKLFENHLIEVKEIFLRLNEGIPLKSNISFDTKQNLNEANIDYENTDENNGVIQTMLHKQNPSLISFTNINNSLFRSFKGGKPEYENIIDDEVLFNDTYKTKLTTTENNRPRSPILHCKTHSNFDYIERYSFLI